jgi:tRNA (cmo5U34)-methyltransferase
MKRNGQLSDGLHVLLHLAEHDGPLTSETLAKGLSTHPVVIRRILAGLRDHGYVRSEKGHGGGSSLACSLSDLTVRDVYTALGSPSLLAIGNRMEAPVCQVEQAVNATLDQACEAAEALLLARLGQVTLARLRSDLHDRLTTRGCTHEPHGASGGVMARPSDAFADPQAVARYAEGPPRLVPGFADLQRMATLLLAEQAPEDARVLVLGAGGGLELKVFAQAHPGWSFDGVDPAAEMLKQAERTLGSLASRVRLHEGYVMDAPEGPFDAATCLLTLHFVPFEEKLRTLVELRRRLKPGAPFVCGHFSFPQGEGERTLWLSRYAAFAVASGVEPGHAEQARAWIHAHLNVLTPEQDEALLREAGFSGTSLFYAGFAFRGWVAYA